MKAFFCLVMSLAMVFVFVEGSLAKGPSAAPQVVRITGVITAIDATGQQIVVNDVVVQVTPNTAIYMGDAEVSFETLAIGMTVKVCGHFVSDLLVANKINIMYKGK